MKKATRRRQLETLVQNPLKIIRKIAVHLSADGAAEHSKTEQGSIGYIVFMHFGVRASCSDRHFLRWQLCFGPHLVCASNG